MGAVLGIPERLAHPKDEHNELIPYNAMDPRVYFVLATDDGDELGRVVFKLSKKTHPQLTENFRLLCTGEKSCALGLDLHYKKTHFHAICPKKGIVVGGDVVNRNGSGGHAATDVSFTDRNATLPKEVGALCMLNQSSKSVRFDSQFFVLLDKIDHCEDGVAFGKVTEGFDVLRQVLKFGSDSGIPSRRVIIADCGQL
ncbi:hypothetical protein QR680_006601 [Steinernema hermaphroditum]|uniref:peptidylprolyl isomerase n=1 Tax=Steinernema hermaphroditum TaxID=289476 RepID=A0AA39LXD7_9BILA|nr:hypothetical protein QR680_006601 [Steinernema hermaphroditum]